MDKKPSGWSIIELNEENYEPWRKQATMILGMNDLSDLINAVYVSKLSTEERKKESQGRFFISATLSLNDKKLVVQCNTVKQTFEKLESRYKRSDNMYTLNNRLALIRLQKMIGHHRRTNSRMF